MHEETLKSTETENIAQTVAREIKRPFEIGSEKHIKRVALPPGWTIEENDDEHLLDRPIRISGTAYAHDADSFINYVNRHANLATSTIFCQANYENDEMLITSIIDDHTENEPAWGAHRISFSPRHSVEYKNWVKNNRRSMPQVEFALFLEQNLEDIANVEGMPTGSQLLEMALQFEANQDMRLKSHVRLQSGGVQMQFVQDDDDATIARMTMFDKLSIGIPVFWNAEPYLINARLRYRVREGKATFWYELIRPEKVFEAACKTIIERIKSETELPFFFGTSAR
ncbi:Uncharacterized conserved protein YfdQ, DUF2303 family [Nitrosomonas aestuarii]|uniref:Uncharacterized conserved protein YfdQ, DUF2303 family n=1 Tax=Nitrosomonas aestuarii TaxID=52441 RepID=A0A1I4C2W5_9PROT|nr:DUF2303 family protein [Nitrosomonas aestuarii]SFK75422.1 Uncharacterized conserved protein YfdQ, DUF2303 family [Nitrosomonas aestuarii]